MMSYEWHKENTLGALEADKASAVAVLHGLHENFDITIQPIDELFSNGKTRVVATTNIEKGMLWLPGCVPKQSRVLEQSEHPSAVSLWVVVTRSTEAAANHPDGNVIRTREFKVVPEFKVPTMADQAIGSQPAVADFKNEKHSGDGKWLFDDGTPDTMHPFWGVRRLTYQQLQKERNETKNGEWLPRFTCEIAYQHLSEVCVYSMVRCDNRTKNIAVPFITTAGAVEPGEELILEVQSKTKEKRKRTWRDVAKEEAEKLKKLTRAQQSESGQKDDGFP